MKKKKLTIISDGIYPFSMGGSHRFIYELVETLDKRLFDILCVFPEIGKDSSFGISEKKNINFNTLILTSIFSNKLLRLFYSFFFIYKKCFNTVINSDVVNIHYLPALFCLRKVKSHNIKILYTFHGPWSEEFGYSIIGRLESKNTLLLFIYKLFFSKIVNYLLHKIEKYSLSHASEFMCLSKYMKMKLIRNFNINKNKITIIHSGVDFKKFNIKSSKKYRSKISYNKKYVFLTVRRLEKRMGIDNLIIACNILKKIDGNFVLNICGKGNHYEYLEKLIKNFDLGNHVKLIGYVKEEQLPEILSNSDLFILPSVDLEGFGLVVLESMACGTPVLTSPFGGSKEILLNIDPNLIMKDVEPETIYISLINFMKDKINIKDKDFYRNYVINNYSWRQSANEFQKWIEK